MKIGVISSRGRDGAVYEDSAYVYRCLEQVLRGAAPDVKAFEIVSGGGQGPESFAIQYAKENGHTIKRIPPRIRTLGVRAFFERNRAIASLTDVSVVFWGGEETNVPQFLRDNALLGKLTYVFPI